MEVSLGIQELRNGVMRKESSMNSQPSTLRNKMVLLRGKIEPWFIWQDQCSPSTMFRIAFGPKQSTMPLIDFIAIDFITRPHMSCSLEGSQISHILECLVVNTIFSRRELGYPSSKVNVMKVFFLGINLIARLIGSTTKLMALLKKPMVWSLMKPMGLIMNNRILMMWEVMVWEM